MLANYPAFLAFVAAMTGTPGPGNLALMALGRSFGFRAALPFLGGVALGFTALALLAGFGLGEVLAASPGLALALKIAGGLYIGYLAARLVLVRPGAKASGRPFAFGEGLLLHPLNPKSWGMLAAAAGQFLDPARPVSGQAAVFVATFVAGMLCAHCLWCLAGSRLLGREGLGTYLPRLNALMALLMVGATAWAMAA